jgi:hypothetical protein
VTPNEARPRLAIRQGMYTQIGQVDAWLTKVVTLICVDLLWST